MAGFGRAAFGKAPFGRSDTGGDLLIQLFPDEYFDDSLTLPVGQTTKDNTVDPLLFLLQTYANSVLLRRTDIDNFVNILDPETAPLNLVRLMGDTLGIDVDQNDPEFLQRSFLKNASQWLQIKASTRGYEVRGLASGFVVQVVNYWRIDESYIGLIPAFFLFQLRPTEADPTAPYLWHTDQPPGTFSGTPTSEDPTYAKSSYLKTVFSVAVYQPNVNYNALLDLVILKIRDVVGIHHELTAPQFLVELPITTSISASMECDETTDLQFNETNYYDIIPADEVPTDSSVLSVSITMQDEVEEVFISAIPTVTLQIVDSGINVNIPLSISAAVECDEEVEFCAVQESQSFDPSPTDCLPLDGPISVVISTGLDFETDMSVDASEITLSYEDDEYSQIQVDAVPSVAMDNYAMLDISVFDDEESIVDIISESDTLLFADVAAVVDIVSDYLAYDIDAIPSIALTPEESSVMPNLTESVSTLFVEAQEAIYPGISGFTSISIQMSEFWSTGVSGVPSISLVAEDTDSFGIITLSVSGSFVESQESIQLGISGVPALSTEFQEYLATGLSGIPLVSLIDKESTSGSAIVLGLSAIFNQAQETTEPSINGIPLISISKMQEQLSFGLSGTPAIMLQIRETVSGSGVSGLSVFESNHFDAALADVMPLDGAIWVFDNITSG